MARINTEKAPQPTGPYSQAMRAGDYIFVSGQIGLDADGTLVEGGIQAETEQAIRNIEAILKSCERYIDGPIKHSADLSHVVKVEVCMADMHDIQSMEEVYTKHFAHKPARTVIEARPGPYAAVQIACIAYAPLTVVGGYVSGGRNDL